MTQENKKLLLKDICSRLPYTYNSKGIIDCKYSIKGIISYIGKDMVFTVIGITGDTLYLYNNEACEIEDFKPYLRPMTSMTEEEWLEFDQLLEEKGSEEFGFDIDWLNVHHFDYRGLIEKGLALKAPEGIYK